MFLGICDRAVVGDFGDGDKCQGKSLQRIDEKLVMEDNFSKDLWLSGEGKGMEL